VSHGVDVTIVYSFQGACFHVTQISLQQISQIVSVLFACLWIASDACFNFDLSLVLFYRVFFSFVDSSFCLCLSMIQIPLCRFKFFTFVDRHILLIVFFQFEGSVLKVV